MKALDDQRRKLRRNLLALGGSGLFHLLVLVVFLQAGLNAYRLPAQVEPPTPPIDVEIAPPEILPPVVVPSRRFLEPSTPTPSVPQPQPVPLPQPQPPQVVPLPQPQPQPAPPHPVIVRPLVAPIAPPAPTEARRLAPQVLVTPSLPTLETTAPAPAPAPAPPAPARAPPAPAETAPPAPIAPRLNIHKSEHEAPVGVPTLPMAPSPTPSPGRTAGGASASGGGGGGGSRLEGLTPYPAGVLPNGGPGLRGSLVGCANAQAVGLSSVERAHCESRFGSSIGGAPKLDLIPAERRAGFDRDAARAERDRVYRNSSTAAGDTTAPGGISPQQSGTHVRLPP